MKIIKATEGMYLTTSDYNMFVKEVCMPDNDGTLWFEVSEEEKAQHQSVKEDGIEISSSVEPEQNLNEEIWTE